MQDPGPKPALYAEAQVKYGHFREMAGRYLEKYFRDPVDLRKSERIMIHRLGREYLRLRALVVFPTDVEKETLKLIRFFFLRERREDVRFRDYSNYLREFMKKNRHKMIGPWNPPPDFSFDDVVCELTSRISPPWNDPFPVLTEWIPRKLREAAAVIPSGILENGGIGKVFRVVSGVYLYALTDLKSDTPVEEARIRLELALKRGFYFGLLHPLADDLLDSANHLSSEAKRELLRLMDYWIGGEFSVPDTLTGYPSVKELKRCIRELYDLFTPDERREVILLSYFLHFAQIEDMRKDPSSTFPRESIYIPVMLKGAMTRLISCRFSGTKLSAGLTNDILETGLVFQLMDDFRDLQTDLEEGSFTPFTHYCLCQSARPVNPWLIYARALDLFIRMSPNRIISSRSLLRRVAISIQNFNTGHDPHQGNTLLTTLFNECPESYSKVKKILRYPKRIVDPDKALFEPVDRYYRYTKPL